MRSVGIRSRGNAPTVAAGAAPLGSSGRQGADLDQVVGQDAVSGPDPGAFGAVDPGSVPPILPLRVRILPSLPVRHFTVHRNALGCSTSRRGMGGLALARDHHGFGPRCRGGRPRPSSRRSCGRRSRSVACAGIAVSLHPVLRQYAAGMALGSVGFRLIEGMFTPSRLSAH